MTGIYSRLPLILAVVLAVTMLASLGWQGWQFYQSEQVRQSTAETPPATRSYNDQPGSTAVNLTSINLFGTPGVQTAAEPQSTENLPETNLRLFLRGVLAGDDETVASALIEDSDSETEAYLVGDKLPGNAKLRSVYANRVIIERSGKLENLYFPETSDNNGIDVRGSSSRNATSPPPAPSSQQAQPTRAAPAATSDRRDEIRRRLEALRERLRQNSN